MKEVSHIGRVVSVNKDITEVEIIRGSACSSCQARSMCGMTDEKSAIISVPTDGFDIHEVGDQVEVCLKHSMGMKAVWISYVIPLILLLAVLSVLCLLEVNELVCGLSGVAAVAAYYVVLYFVRDHLNNEFVFYIK